MSARKAGPSIDKKVVARSARRATQPCLAGAPASETERSSSSNNKQVTDIEGQRTRHKAASLDGAMAAIGSLARRVDAEAAERAVHVGLIAPFIIDRLALRGQSLTSWRPIGTRPWHTALLVAIAPRNLLAGGRWAGWLAARLDADAFVWWIPVKGADCLGLHAVPRRESGARDRRELYCLMYARACRRRTSQCMDSVRQIPSPLCLSCRTIGVRGTEMESNVTTASTVFHK